MHILSIFTYLHKLHFIHSTIVECHIYCIFAVFYYVHCCLLVSDIVWNNVYLLDIFLYSAVTGRSLDLWNVNASNNNNETFKKCTSSKFLHNNEHPHITPNNISYGLLFNQMTDMTNYYMIYMYHIYSHNLCPSVIYASVLLGRFWVRKKNLYFFNQLLPK